MRWRILGVLITLSTLCATAPVGATLVRGFSLSAMSQEAHAIVRAEVVGEEVVYDAYWGRVYTLSRLQVVESWHGAHHPGDVIVLKQLGGTLDGRTTKVPGTASLALGQEVVCFTRSDGHYHYLIGLGQGLYRVNSSSAVEAHVRRRLDGLELAPRLGPVRPTAPSQMRLETLKQRVHHALSAGGTR